MKLLRTFQWIDSWNDTHRHAFASIGLWDIPPRDAQARFSALHPVRDRRNDVWNPECPHQTAGKPSRLKQRGD